MAIVSDEKLDKPATITAKSLIKPKIELPETDDVRELAKAATPASVRALADIVMDNSASPQARIAAATALLDRGHGKPHQSQTIEGTMSLIVQCAIPSTPNSEAPKLIEQ
jgi:hypothetical protein